MDEKQEIGDWMPAPGDMVKLVDVEGLNGMVGDVVDPDSVNAIRRQNQVPSQRVETPPGRSWVVLTIYGRQVPVCFAANQLERVPRN